MFFSFSQRSINKFYHLAFSPGLDPGEDPVSLRSVCDETLQSL